MQHILHRCTRLGIGAAVLAAGLVLAPLAARHADAFAGVCYDDPIVRLSNGDILSMAVKINDRTSDVRSISYALHAPAGVFITQYFSDPGALGQVETFQLVNDWSGGYEIETQVNTGTQGVSVTALDSLNGQFQHTSGGQSNQDLVLTF